VDKIVVKDEKQEAIAAEFPMLIIDQTPTVLKEIAETAELVDQHSEKPTTTLAPENQTTSTVGFAVAPKNEEPQIKV